MITDTINNALHPVFSDFLRTVIRFNGVPCNALTWKDFKSLLADTQLQVNLMLTLNLLLASFRYAKVLRFWLWKIYVLLIRFIRLDTNRSRLIWSCLSLVKQTFSLSNSLRLVQNVYSPLRLLIAKIAISHAKIVPLSLSSPQLSRVSISRRSSFPTFQKVVTSAREPKTTQGSWRCSSYSFDHC